MAYRRTKKYTAERIAAMRRGRDRARMANAPQERPPDLPDLRMRIVVERFDHGTERHEFVLRKTRRVDVYSVTVDGKPWKCTGLSGVLEGLRKAMPRVLSPRAVCGAGMEEGKSA